MESSNCLLSLTKFVMKNTLEKIGMGLLTFVLAAIIVFGVGSIFAPKEDTKPKVDKSSISHWPDTITQKCLSSTECQEMMTWIPAKEDPTDFNRFAPATKKDTTHMMEHFRVFKKDLKTLAQLNKGNSTSDWVAMYTDMESYQSVNFFYNKGKIYMAVPHMELMEVKEGFRLMKLDTGKQEMILNSLIFMEIKSNP